MYGVSGVPADDSADAAATADNALREILTSSGREGEGDFLSFAEAIFAEADGLERERGSSMTRADSTHFPRIICHLTDVRVRPSVRQTAMTA